MAVLVPSRGGVLGPEGSIPIIVYVYNAPLTPPTHKHRYKKLLRLIEFLRRWKSTTPGTITEIGKNFRSGGGQFFALAPEVEQKK